MKKKYVVIGASAAGINALQTLRRIDPTASITIISAETEHPYNKCLLVDFLSDSVTLNQLAIGPHTIDEHTQIMLGTTVVAIKPSARQIVVHTGDTLEYDQLLLATGVRPRTLEHGKLRGIYSWYTLGSAQAIKKYLHTNNVQSAIIVGGGLSGIECASALTQQNIRCTIVEQQEQLLPALCDQEKADQVQQLLAHHGVTVMCNQTVERVLHEQEHVTGVQLASGLTVHAPLIITALGTHADSSLMHSAGIHVSREGIVTNQFLQTNSESIYAAGDCIAVYDTARTVSVPSRTWPDAVKQGICAAYNMAGIPRPYLGTVVKYHTTLFDQNFVF